MKYVVSVSKAYKHRGVLHKKSTKKYWFIYYYDEEGDFHSEQVSYLKAMYYKTQKLHRMKYICIECGQFFHGLAKSSKQEIDCPYCEAY